MKAVHALWSRIKNRLVRLITQERAFTKSSYLASTDLFCSSKFILQDQCYLFLSLL